jgi:hypothetical protein
MKSTLTIQSFKNGRSKIGIEIELDEAENALLNSKPVPKHVDSPKSVPCQFHENPDPKVRTVRGLPIYNGSPIKAYVLPNARKIPLNRPLVGKSLLRLFLPGTMDLGFVNEHELPKLEKWWGETRTHIADQLKERLFGIANHVDPEFVADVKVDLEQEHKLNPFDEREQSGIRKRSFDDF